MRPKPLALIILDGWGVNPEETGNAVQLANTPYIDQLMEKYPKTYLACSGEAVGLPAGQMGNSEVGHLNMGSGRIVYQDLTRISLAVKNNELVSNPILQAGMENAKEPGKALHLLGLLSDGGVHSHITHLYGLLEMAKEMGVHQVYVHAILDGRDVPPKSAKEYIQALEDQMEKIGVGTIATVSGRYYTMDRDQRWDRIERAYRTLVYGDGEMAKTAINAVDQAYTNEQTDEFVKPTVIVNGDGEPTAKVGPGDTVIFYNFRADRARQITRALALPEFSSFDRGEFLAPHFICMTEYDETFNLPIAFPTVEIKETLAEVLSKAGLKQLRIAETEKYAHVTFFFNGGKEDEVEGEDRKLIPSPKVATYDEKPSMSANEVTETLLAELERDFYDVIILNYANCDMVGHTGVLAAAIEATETVDQCLAKLIPVILKRGGQVLLTSDHGNAEQMFNEEGAHTAHTTNPVPLVYIGGAENVHLAESGKLADVAPTMLQLLGVDQPSEMTGDSLLRK